MNTILKRKGEDWRRKLPRPIVIRGGKTLHILGDCRDYAVDLPVDVQMLDKWQHAARLMKAAALGGSLIAVVDQFERILLHENKVILEPTPAEIAGRQRKKPNK